MRHRFAHGLAAATLIALGLAPVQHASAAIEPLVVGRSVTSGDKLFTLTGCASTLGACVEADPVGFFENIVQDGRFGINIFGPNGADVVPAGEDTTLNFRVDVIGGDPLILGWIASATGDDGGRVEEGVRDSTNFFGLGSLEVVLGTNDTDSIDFSANPQSTIFFDKDINGILGAVATAQQFAVQPVPAPAGLGLLAVGLIALGMLGRHRRG